VFLIRETPLFDLVAILFHAFADKLGSVNILLDKFGLEGFEETEHITPDKHLPVGNVARTDTDGRDIDRLCDCTAWVESVQLPARPCPGSAPRVVFQFRCRCFVNGVLCGWSARQGVAPRR